MVEANELERRIWVQEMAAKFAEDVAAIIQSDWLHQKEKIAQANKAVIAARARRAGAILKTAMKK